MNCKKVNQHWKKAFAKIDINEKEEKGRMVIEF